MFYIYSAKDTQNFREFRATLLKSVRHLVDLEHLHSLSADGMSSKASGLPPFGRIRMLREKRIEERPLTSAFLTNPKVKHPMELAKPETSLYTGSVYLESENLPRRSASQDVQGFPQEHSAKRSSHAD